MADILLTGATGFIGSHLVHALARRGVRGRALVRATSNASGPRRAGFELVVGALDDPESLARAVAGTGTVVHLAAATQALRPGAFHDVNAEGTRRLVAAMEVAGARRIVYLSSMAAVGPARNGPMHPDQDPAPLTAYGRSKLEGERHALGSRSVKGVVLRPPAVYGPGDRNLLPFFRLARRGLLFGIGAADRLVQFVHVTDLTAALVRASEADDVEGVVHVAEPRAYGWDEVLDRLAAAVGRRGVRVGVPVPVVRTLAWVSEMLARAAGRPTIFDREKVHELIASWTCETDRARRELGFEASIPLAEGLRETAAWYRRSGWL